MEFRTAGWEKHSDTRARNAMQNLHLRIGKPEYSELFGWPAHLMTMNTKSAFLIIGVLAAVLTFGGCTGSTESPAQRHEDANTPAGKNANYQEGAFGVHGH